MTSMYGLQANSPPFPSSPSLNPCNSENFQQSQESEMLNSEQDVPQKWLQIKEDDKFFSRLLSKESSRANPSLRVYYGGVTGAVPFTWESQPGTPKHTFGESSLPPLTPPPSYFSNSMDKKPNKKHSRSNLLHSIFPRVNNNNHNNNPKKPHVLSSPSLSSSCSSWSSPRSSSMSGSLTPNFLRRRRYCSSRSSFDSGADYEEEAVSPTSTLCFHMGSGLRGRCSVVVMKKAFLSMVGHGSGQGTA